MPCPPLRAAVAVILQCSALLGAVCAQSTLVVGPGGFAQIRDAVAVAAPGDVVVMQPGVYAHFTAQVACTIRAAVPGTQGQGTAPCRRKHEKTGMLVNPRHPPRQSNA
ncbi:MAG: hypothetical protein H6835_14510 [Planctomycetes bacterium]|nr:hypothetical protein [Planctomycetota bacterium]